eukprot:2550-Heterococcus_DN1.PRE.4
MSNIVVVVVFMCKAIVLALVSLMSGSTCTQLRCTALLYAHRWNVFVWEDDGHHIARCYNCNHEDAASLTRIGTCSCSNATTVAACLLYMLLMLALVLTLHLVCCVYCTLCMLYSIDVGFLHPPSTSSDGLAGMSGTLRHIIQERVMRRQSFNTSNTAATPQQSPQKGVRGNISGGSTGDDKQQQLQQRMTRYEPHKIERLQDLVQGPGGIRLRADCFRRRGNMTTMAGVASYLLVSRVPLIEYCGYGSMHSTVIQRSRHKE